jgi:hypothetical protein
LTPIILRLLASQLKRYGYDALKYSIIHKNTEVILMSEKKVKFEFEKQNKNSVRYKEVPEDGMPPVIGSIYVQKWFAGDSKNIDITINKKD